VNCSATVVHKIAEWFTPERLAAFPNVDGVVAFSHSIGCGMEMTGEPMQLLRRTMALARHPNLAAALVIGLGCERNQLKGLMEQEQLVASPNCTPSSCRTPVAREKPSKPAIAAVRALLPERTRRSGRPFRQPPQRRPPVRRLGRFLVDHRQPGAGRAVDILARHGGTGILSETPEIYGVEHTLTRRAASRAIGEKLIERCAGGRTSIRFGRDVRINGQVSPGNQVGRARQHFRKVAGLVDEGRHRAFDGGLSLRRAGGRPGLRVHGHAGLRPVSATGQIAGGANLIAFTTGRG